MQLRPYQSKLIQATSHKLTKSKRVVMQLSTGGGKTVCFSTIVERFLAKDMFRSVLILTDRTELFRQTFKAIDRIGITPYEYSAQAKPKSTILSRCVMGMAQTIIRRKGNHLRKPDLIIIDEAHEGVFKKIFDLFPDSLYIGATATPLSASKKDPLNNYYGDIACVIDTPELIELGYLCPAKTYAVKAIDDTKLTKRNGEYTDASQLAQLNETQIKADLIAAYHKHAQGKKTIVFCVNVQHTLDTYELFKSNGLETYQITSHSNAFERTQMQSAFHRSASGIMVNCGILTKGYDHPPIECVIVDRSTTSLPLWLQMCGRGSRISPETNKTDFTIIDLGNNWKRHLLWQAERDWTDLFRNPPQPSKKADSVQGVKECPKCHFLMPPTLSNCPECNYTFPHQTKKIIQGDTFLVSPTLKAIENKTILDLSVPELIELQDFKGYKQGFIVRVLRAKGLDYLKEYAQLKSYKSGWVKMQSNGDKNFTNFKIKLI